MPRPVLAPINTTPVSSSDQENRPPPPALPRTSLGMYGRVMETIGGLLQLVSSLPNWEVLVLISFLDRFHVL